MASHRLALLAALVVAGFVPVTMAAAQAPVDWYTDTGAGGVLAQPPHQSKSGGAEAPRTATGDQDVPEGDISATPPVVHSAQAEPVLGAPSDDAPPAADEPAAAPRAAQEGPTVTGGQNQESSNDGGLIGSLPLTGLQLALVAGAGLLLLVAGAALRPRRRAPVPR